MTAPRLEVDLDKIHHNARTLVQRLGERGIQVLGITKATLGSPEIARALIRAGVVGLGDSRIENIRAMRRAGVQASMSLIRSPMISQAEQVVTYSDMSFNTELDVIRELSSAAQAARVTHGIVLMVELGDLREGIMPEHLEGTVREALRLPNIRVDGIGSNLACRSGVAPDDRNMAELSELAESIERTLELQLALISGGNSGNLQWALATADVGRINHLRLGESVLLGCDPIDREPIEGLCTDAVTLVAEVIETKTKPSRPWGDIGQSAFGTRIPVVNRGPIVQSILALGHQDTDPAGLEPPPGIDVIGASSDHLIVSCGDHRLRPGDELRLRPNYSALVRAMTSPFVSKVMKGGEVGSASTVGEELSGKCVVQGPPG